MCRAAYAFPGLSVKDCYYLLTEPSELCSWLHFVEDAQPGPLFGTGDESKKPYVWKSRGGFPYGYVRFAHVTSLLAQPVLLLARCFCMPPIQ
jgi:hypothetical protein